MYIYIDDQAYNIWVCHGLSENRGYPPSGLLVGKMMFFPLESRVPYFWTDPYSCGN